MRPQAIRFETTASSGCRPPLSPGALGLAVVHAAGAAVLIALAWAGFLGAVIFPEAQMALFVALPMALALFSDRAPATHEVALAKTLR